MSGIEDVAKAIKSCVMITAAVRRRSAAQNQRKSLHVQVL